ncbi:alginate lyase [Edaphobacter aggregans]|uniref:Alginate lyase n=1 Tax=Edaphobacter aggregans TaxID=570835 RepID=A0A3R9PRZ2_9BACT|nr:alginate lyase family protein [Edaphobacter aggregans]RSL16577.1 alginate lyase [Edaphobacter aggregans]
MRTSRRVVAAFLAMVALIFCSCPTTQAQTTPFKHPGVLVSQAQLDYIKTMIAAHTEPFYSAFLKAQNSNIGQLNYQIQGPPATGIIECGPTSNPNFGCSAADNDSSAAYLQALLWYITGNQTYANNAIAILNTYGYNLKGYTNSNAPLQAAWDSEKFPRAAEIIRYTNAGWADADIQQFKTMLSTVILPGIINGSTSNGNWEISMIEGMINIGVFNDDVATFNKGVLYWKQRIPAYFYYHTDGAAPVPAPRGTASWYGQTVFDSRVDGISQETCRDFGHAQYGISGALDAAETARIQGVDLYNDASSNALLRLTSALEFNAKYQLANSSTVPSYVCGGTVTLQVYPTDEIGYNNYHNRQGLELPLTIQYLNQVIRQLANPTEYHIMVYETLSHGGDASFLQPFLMRSPSTAASIRGGSSTTFTINIIPGSDPNPTVAFNVSGLPAGVTYSFSPSTVTGAGSSTLTITADSTTASGVYPLTVTGVGATAMETSNLPLTLTVNAASSDFTIAASPSVITAVAGDIANFTMTFATSTSYLGNVALSVTGGLPAGASATFSSPTIGSGAPTSTLSVATLGTTTPGAYPITVSATDGSTTHSTTALLIINSLSNACIQQLGNNWISGTIPTQTGTFTAEWDATPSTALNNSNVGLSLGPQSAFTGLAIAGRFNPTGQIDARSGGAFVAANTINYVAGLKYHFRAVVNVPANTYSIYVTPFGQSELTVGTNYAFRTEQKGITSLNYWDAISQVGTVQLCNLVIDTPPTQGTVQLVTTAVLNQLGDGTYEATITVKNNGTGTAPAVQLTGATLGTAAGSPLPVALGDIQPGSSAITAVVFPSSAGAPGTAAAERYTGTYTGGTFGGSIRATLPGGK